MYHVLDLLVQFLHMAENGWEQNVFQILVASNWSIQNTV